MGFIGRVDSHMGGGAANLALTVYKTKQKSPQLPLQRQTWILAQ